MRAVWKPLVVLAELSKYNQATRQNLANALISIHYVLMEGLCCWILLLLCNCTCKHSEWAGFGKNGPLPVLFHRSLEKWHHGIKPSSTSTNAAVKRSSFRLWKQDLIRRIKTGEYLHVIRLACIVKSLLPQVCVCVCVHSLFRTTGKVTFSLCKSISQSAASSHLLTWSLYITMQTGLSHPTRHENTPTFI